MKPEDRDILFGDRFGGWDGEWGGAGAGPWPMPGVDVDALMDAYFDGDISDDDRVRLFELLRRDPDRCLQFVEMQRATLLLERAPAGPDQTESILNSLGRYQLSSGAGWARSRYRIGPRVMRSAIAAAVVLGGAGLVLLGQLAPSRSALPQRAAAPGQGTAARQAQAVESSRMDSVAAPSAIASSPPAASGRPPLNPGRLRSLAASLSGDGAAVETPIRGLAGREAGVGALLADSDFLDRALLDSGLTPDPGAAGIDAFEGFGPASPRDVRRLMGYSYGGYMPWGMYGAWDADLEARRRPPAPPPARP